MITKFKKFSIKLITYDKKIQNIIINSKPIQYILNFMPLEDITFEFVNYDKYLKNIEYLTNMPKKERYNKKTRYAVGIYNNKEIYLTEFLVAKQFGYIEKFQGHKELKNYFKLIPFVFSNNMFDEIFQNLDNGREIYSFFYKKNYRLFHILDENNDLVSCFVNSEKNFNKQINKKFIFKSAREGGYFSILSPAEPFWRHADLIDELYQKLKNNSISQNDFIKLVDIILSSKEKIQKYKKHLDKLSTVEKIEVLEEIENLEKIISQTEKKIDKLVYKIYNLTDEEIKIIKGK